MKRARSSRKKRRLWPILALALIACGGVAAWSMYHKNLPALPVVSDLTKRSTTTAPIDDQRAQLLAQQNAELSQLLDRIVAAKGDYAIAVSEPNGRRASTHGDQQFTSASTYKLYVAYAVFKEIDAGRLQWSDVVYQGRSAEDCFAAMIVESHNECAKAFGRQIGWQTITGMMRSLGLTATHVETDHHQTTANDLALFLAKLLAGDLLMASQRDQLLGLMKRQIYRDGIPAGVDARVANKPGFLDGLLHDAGIVYGAKGPYVLVILSDGSSWRQLADAARQIDTFMQQ